MRTGTLDELVAVVADHYSRSDEPLLLSRLGQRLGDVSYRAFGGLAAAIVETGKERLKILNPTGVPGIEAVALAGPSMGKVEAVVAEMAARSDAACRFDKLPVPVRLAFCVGAATDKVALNLTVPFRYVRLDPDAKAHADLRMIAGKFRHPGLYLRTASEADRAALWRSFSAWVSDQGLTVNLFRAHEVGKEAGPNALDRLMSAQDDDVRSRIRLPGDIAEILRAHG